MGSYGQGSDAVEAVCRAIATGQCPKVLELSDIWQVLHERWPMDRWSEEMLAEIRERVLIRMSLHEPAASPPEPTKGPDQGFGIRDAHYDEWRYPLA